MNKRKKVFRKVLLMLLCCFALGGSVVACNKDEETTKKSDSKKESKSKKKGRFITTSEKGVIEDAQTDEGVVIVIFNDGNTVSFEMNTYEGYGSCYSQDGSVACFYNGEGEFYIVKDGKVIEDELAWPEADPVVISAYGDTVAYFTDLDYDSNWGFRVGKLNLYDTKQRKAEVIAEKAIVEYIELSPNGKTVAYIAPSEVGAYRYMGYCSVDGKEPFEIGKEAYCLAIADDAKYIYYGYEGEEALYVKAGEDGEELLLTGKYDFRVYVNADVSEVMFNDSGDVYISVNGTESKYLGGGGLPYFVYSDEAIISHGYEKGIVIYTGISSFAEAVICSSGNVFYYIDSDYQMLEIDAGVNGNYLMAEDGKTLVYRDAYGDVKRWESSEPEKSTLLCENMGDVYLLGAGTLKNIYFGDAHGNLYYIGEDGPELLAEEITDVEVSSDEEYCYFVLDEKETFVFTGEGEAESIFSATNDCEMWKSGEVILVGDEGEEISILYRAVGEKVKELCTVEY